MNRKRNSSIELLKIIAMILIVFCHAVPCYGDKSQISYISVGIASENISIIILNIFKYMGQIGNIIFLMCSCYFLVDSKRTKKEKILNMILDCFTISILWLSLVLLYNHNVSNKTIIKQLFPITFENNWFIGCYILLYFIHPLLNKIIDNINKKQLLRVNISFIILYSGIQFILSGKYYFNYLIGFIYIYFLVAYVKKYMFKFRTNKKLNCQILIISIIMNILLILFTNFLGLRIKFFENRLLKWINISSPFLIMISLTLLNIFSIKNYYNKYINYLSSVSLIFYLIHENMMFRDYIKPLFYQNIFGYGHILLWVCIEAIGLFIGGMILAILYKETIQKVVHKISGKLYRILSNKYRNCEEKLLKLS